MKLIGLEHSKTGGLKIARRLRWASWCLLTLGAACTGAVSATPGGSDYTDQKVGDGVGGGGTQGLPCDIAALLEARCISCHTNPPVGKAVMALLTYEDLTAPSNSDASKSVAQLALERMQSPYDPMPPSPGAPATAEEIGAFAAWVGAGTPQGDCGAADAGPNPFDVPAQCTSGTFWTGGDEESPFMHPGGACVACHKQKGEGPQYAIAGTVFPTAHEPTDCNAQVAEGPPIDTAVIEITDANGVVSTIAVNKVGNFFRKAAVAKPYKARVLYDGKERVMVAEQTSGDCNVCHTQNGKDDAPGRVLLP